MHGGGDGDFYGMITKDIFNIPKNRFVMMLQINETDTEIHWLENEIDDILIEAIDMVDYDFRLFELLNLKINKLTVSMNFTVKSQ